MTANVTFVTPSITTSIWALDSCRTYALQPTHVLALPPNRIVQPTFQFQVKLYMSRSFFIIHQMFNVNICFLLNL